MEEHTTKEPHPTESSDSNLTTDTDIHSRLRTVISSLLTIWREGGPNCNSETQLRKELETLLRHPDAVLDFFDPDFEPLILLSAQGKENDTLFKLLIAHDPDAGPNPDFPAPSNEVLFWASTHGHACLVKRLLEVDGIDPNVMDDEVYGDGETPLTCAAGNDAIEVLRVLLDDERVDVNLCPSWGKGTAENGNRPTHTALWWAVTGGKERAARLLVERGAVLPRIDREVMVRRMLFEGVEKGSVTILEIILRSCSEEREAARARGQCRINSDIGEPNWLCWSNYHRRTLLSLAAGAGDVSVLNILLRYTENISGALNVPDLYGRTAIWYAASGGHDEALRVLLPYVDNPRAINFMDEEARSALAEAVEQLTSRREYPATHRSRALARRADVVRQLLNHYLVTTESLGDEQIATLLGRSVRGEYVEIVKELAKKDGRVNRGSTYLDGSKEKTLVSWAEEGQHQELLDLLLAESVVI
ncbi:ankyrin repeat-containing domain protein [Aspergillus lucknowensis]|uniref:Ankyrin repeat-containing domain protein n=1 Tax=Aspergillus lucknowensis TaxID=176173 RepID=A0ABR4LDE2_9EURO